MSFFDVLVGFTDREIYENAFSWDLKIEKSIKILVWKKLGTKYDRWQNRNTNVTEVEKIWEASRLGTMSSVIICKAWYYGCPRNLVGVVLRTKNSDTYI